MRWHIADRKVRKKMMLIAGFLILSLVIPLYILFTANESRATTILALYFSITSIIAILIVMSLLMPDTDYYRI